MKRGAYYQLTTNVTIMFKYLSKKGRIEGLQWIPSHCGIVGNELVEAEAQQSRHNETLLVIPITRKDANAILY